MKPPDPPEKLLSHSGWLRDLSRSLVGDVETADDLVQDTWLSTLNKPPEREAGPWLKRVLRNAARQYWRGESRRRRRERLAARDEKLPSSQELVARMEFQKRIIECVQGLAEPYRTAIVLRFYEGLSAAEIARRKRLPAGTVRSHLARGLAELRRRLDQRHGGRKGWSALLVPWLDLKPSIAGASVLALAKGLLTMSTGTKLLLTAAAAATVAIVGYQLIPSSPGPLPQPAAVTDAPNPPLVRAVGDQRERETSAAVTARQVLETPGIADPAPIQNDSLLAQIVDAKLQPLPAAMLTFGSLDIDAESDADGMVRMAFDLRDDGRYTLTIARDGYATKFLGVEIDADAPTDLGQIVLHPGGHIAGRVEDSKGASVAGARILVGDGEAELRLGSTASRRAGPEQHSSSVETVSGYDGTFELAGVATGALRIWAGHQDMLWSVSDPFELSAHETVDDLVLRLDPLAEEDVLVGIVFGTDGRPLAGCTIRQDCSGVGINATRFTRTDAEGRFRLLMVPGARNDLRAEDPEQRWSDATVRDARPDVELVLRFVETRLLSIRVLGTAGVPLDQAEVEGLAYLGTTSHSVTSGASDNGEAGRWLLREPDEDYRLRVRASGHAAVELGPFQPGSLPSPFEVQLEPMSGIHGRVLADDQPVPGTRVELYRALTYLSTATSFPVIYHHGFLVLQSPYVLDSTTAGADGEFSFTPQQPGSYVIRAEHDGYAPDDLEVRDFRPVSASEELELQLTSGGTIEGRVIPPPDEGPAGTQVVASRADGKHRVQRVGADGRFRFDRLTPGRWEVRAVEDDLKQSTVHTSAKKKPELAWVCEVFPGQTTIYDVDLSNREPCVVAGRVTVDGRPAAGWSAELRSRDAYSGLPSENPKVVLDALGRFELRTQKNRAYLLSVHAPGDEELYLQAELDLQPGLLPWDLEIETGRIEIENVAAAEDMNESLWLLWQGPTMSSMQRLQADANGRCTIPRFPAGNVSVIRYPSDPWNPQSSRPVVTGRIEAGQTTRLVIR